MITGTYNLQMTCRSHEHIFLPSNLTHLLYDNVYFAPGISMHLCKIHTVKVIIITHNLKI